MFSRKLSKKCKKNHVRLEDIFGYEPLGMPKTFAFFPMDSDDPGAGVGTRDTICTSGAAVGDADHLRRNVPRKHSIIML